jgi:hypothetical protein
VDAGFPITDALLVSMGTGIVNWLFAIPAIYTIDTFGRRNLLLTTFPIMSLCLLFTGFAFYAPDTAAEGSYNTLRVGLIATGIYLFMAVYSFPLYIRDTGMSFATATCWGFNFIISFTWPALLDAFGPTGAFGWYAAWNAAATVYCYFLLPETKVNLHLF